MSLFRRNVELLTDLQANSKFIGEQRALTGRYNPSTGNIEPMRSLLTDNNKIWVRLRNNENAVEAWNIVGVKSLSTNLGVIVEEDEAGELYVKRPLNRYNADTAGSSASAIAAPDIVATSSDSVTYQALDGLRPQATATGLEVTISSYNTRNGLFPETTFDFASLTPPTSGKYRWAVCYLDTTDLTLGSAVASTEQDLVDFDRDDIGTLVTIPAYCIRIAAMFLLNGQTTYNADELYDVRELWTSPLTDEGTGYRTETANYTVSPTTEGTILVDTSSNDVTITLPLAASVDGKKWDIQVIDITNNAYIDTTSSEAIQDETLPMQLPDKWDSITVQSVGTYWIIL